MVLRMEKQKELDTIVVLYYPLQTNFLFFRIIFFHFSCNMM